MKQKRYVKDFMVRLNGMAVTGDLYQTHKTDYAKSVELGSTVKTVLCTKDGEPVQQVYVSKLDPTGKIWYKDELEQGIILDRETGKIRATYVPDETFIRVTDKQAIKEAKKNQINKYASLLSLNVHSKEEFDKKTVVSGKTLTFYPHTKDESNVAIYVLIRTMIVESGYTFCGIASVRGGTPKPYTLIEKDGLIVLQEFVAPDQMVELEQPDVKFNIPASSKKKALNMLKNIVQPLNDETYSNQTVKAVSSITKQTEQGETSVTVEQPAVDVNIDSIIEGIFG